MAGIIGIVLAIVVAAALIILLMVFSGMKKKTYVAKGSNRNKNRSKSAIIKECTKKINQDPNNVHALIDLSEVYFEEQDYEKAMPLYNRLFDLIRVHPEIDRQKVAVRHGICCYKMGKTDDAGRSFVYILKEDPKVYLANLYLGKVFYDKKNYEKSVMCLKRAYVFNQSDEDLLEYMGKSLYELKKYKDAAGFLRKALDSNPLNKEIMFILACCLREINMYDKALKIFLHLRLDPEYGPESCLASAFIHEKTLMPEKAVQDYEIALKIETIPKEKKVVIMYKLAASYIQKHDIAKALSLLKQIQSLSPGYKDVDILIKRYQELNQNSNLQVYLLSNINDYSTLCKKFVLNYYQDAKVKIEDLQISSEGVDVMCQVFSDKWEDLELFKFFRSTGAVGELYVRSFHAKMRDTKCERGFCVTAGTYTEECRKFVEGRPIDLIDKQKLITILKRIEK